MANRIGYLQFLSNNKNAFLSDVASVVPESKQALLSLAEEPDKYRRAAEAKEDTVFEEKYIISERTMMTI